jgi:hypothetical protein
MGALTCLAALGALGAPAAAVELLVPAYFYPSADPALSAWDELTAAAASGVPVTAIMNPGNGPGAAFNADYAAAVNAFRGAGGRVLGYVYTCYGNNNCLSGLPPTRSAAEVLADAARYAQWYAIDGVFLDEMSSRADALAFYAEVAGGLRAAQPGWQIVGNAGTATPASYLDVADTIVTFERGTANYDGAEFEPWMSTAAPARQAHLHYNATGTDAMRALLGQAVARGAGYVYITDDRYIPGNATEPNPWDQLPSYWTEELAAVRAASPVPEPPALMLAGLAAVAAFRLRRSTPAPRH